MLSGSGQLKYYKRVCCSKQFGLLGICVIFLIFSCHVSAGIAYYSIADNAVIMYDAPSTKSGKLFVTSANLPVEAIVNVEGWSKVRDSSGSLAWVEQSALSRKRFVVVIVPLADIYQSANESSEIVFQAQENVVMEWLDSDIPGWMRVRHRDGQAGYVRSSQVWGA
jgi:SH3-like domain-containing protein